MTLLDYLQTHSLEEILKDDKLVNELWNCYFSNVYGIDDWDPYEFTFRPHKYVCENCEYYSEDGYSYVTICNFRFHNHEKCPYLNEHKKEIKESIKNFLKKELGD